MILYRDTTRAAGRVPAHLLGAESLCRRESVGGDLVGIASPLVFGPPAGATWHGIADGWEVALGRPLDQRGVNDLARAQPVAIPTRGVVDALGRTWLAPVVLNDKGSLAMPVPWGRDATTGQPCRQPTAAQAAWIAAARAARAEIEADRLASVPIEVAAAWASTLLSATLHLDPAGEVLIALALLDDRLAVQTLLTGSGLGG